MPLHRRLLLKSLLAAPTLSALEESGASIAIRLSDRAVLHVDNPAFAAGVILPPASTIKPFVLLALIDAGKLKQDELFHCSGRLRIDDHEMNCVHPPTPVPMNAARTLAYSCNSAIAHFALRFAADELPQALIRFGFTSPSGIGKSPEAVGTVRRGTVGSTCQLQALGEEGIAITPLELLIAYVRLAAQLKNPRYSAILEGLEGAVEFGTAQAAQTKNAKVAGKTGSITLRSGSPAAWFAGFAPSRNPTIAVVVLTAGHSGGADAAPIASRLLASFL